MSKSDFVCHEEGVVRIAGSDFLHFAVDWMFCQGEQERVSVQAVS